MTRNDHSNQLEWSIRAHSGTDSGQWNLVIRGDLWGWDSGSQFSQFEIAFSASTMCLCVCVFIQPTGRHAMLFQCANARTDHSNTKYNTKYNMCGLDSLRDTLCRFAKVSNDLSTQFINNYHWNQRLHAMYKNISKMAAQSRLVNPRMHYLVLTVTSSGCLKLYLNLWEFGGLSKSLGSAWKPMGIHTDWCISVWKFTKNILSAKCKLNLANVLKPPRESCFYSRHGWCRHSPEGYDNHSRENLMWKMHRI